MGCHAAVGDDEGWQLDCHLVCIPHVLETPLVVQMLLGRPTTDVTLSRYGWLASHASWEHDGTAASLGHHALQPVSYSRVGQGEVKSPDLIARLPYEGLGVTEVSGCATAPCTSLEVYQKTHCGYQSSLVTLVVAVVDGFVISDGPNSRQKKPTLLVWVHYIDEYPGSVQPLWVVKMYVMVRHVLFRLMVLDNRAVSVQLLCNSFLQGAHLA